MQAQDYIISKLEELSQPVERPKLSGENLENEIIRLILSKKFRKYTANDELIQRVRKAVHLSVEKNEPIKFSMFQGAFKLWRLDEAPEADWAELFTYMYFSKWLKPICEIYEPGVLFNTFMDDIILEKLNNISPDETKIYIRSQQAIIDFLKKYQPENMKMSFTPIGGLFESDEIFWEKMNKELAENTELPVLSEKDIARVELNVRPSDSDPINDGWQARKVKMLNAWFEVTGGLGFDSREDEIPVFVQPIALNYLTVGATKNSIMKFWCGVGVLQPKDNSYQMTIRSFNQIAKDRFEWENVSIDGLGGRNFEKIRILQ